jgi:hypothetical protein
MATVCEWFDLKTTRTVFTGLVSKPVATVSGSLASKSTVTVSSGLASKLAVMVFGGLASKPAATVFSGLPSKPVATVFSSLALKLVVMVSWFVPQNQVDFCLSVTPQNRQWEVGVGHTLRSSGLLHVEASPARVSQSDLKTGGGVMMGGVRGTITEDASEAS